MHTWMHHVDEATPRFLVAGECCEGGGGGIEEVFVKIKCLQEAVFISHDLAHFLDLEKSSIKETRGPV